MLVKYRWVISWFRTDIFFLDSISVCCSNKIIHSKHTLFSSRILSIFILSHFCNSQEIMNESGYDIYVIISCIDIHINCSICHFMLFVFHLICDKATDCKREYNIHKHISVNRKIIIFFSTMRRNEELSSPLSYSVCDLK